jgi:DNA-binding response OmpR family regulator
MHSILLIEDENRIREFLSVYFRANNYKVFEAEDGITGLEMFDQHMIDLVILDVMMPKLDGFEVCKRLRHTSDVPIIFLTALEEEEQHLLGYSLGADDYISKPVNINILLAKSKRLLDKRKGHSLIVFDGLKIDQRSRSISIDGNLVEFAPKEYDLLLLLAENVGQVFSRDIIIEGIWGGYFEGGTRVVDNHVKKIRKKLGDYSDMIKTVISIGYKFEV